MPTISRFYGILIQMFYDEKHGPHFHAIYGEDNPRLESEAAKSLLANFPRTPEDWCWGGRSSTRLSFWKTGSGRAEKNR